MQQKSAVSSFLSSQGFPVLQPQIVFLQYDWQIETSLQRVINVNEARGVSQTSADPLLPGGVWA